MDSRGLARRLAPWAFFLCLWALAEELLRRVWGPALAPGPLAVLGALWSLAASGGLWRELLATVLRALTGVLLANIAGFSLGLLCGRSRFLLELTAPAVAGAQSCPPVVWISLVMVFAGTGSLVPAATVFAASLPFVFSTTAQGVMGLPERQRAMSRLYGVPKTREFWRFTLPGVLPFYLAGLSTVLSASWKAAAVAEFLGSHNGVGAQIYWSYAKLDMEALHAWALAIIILGVILEGLVITPLRKRAALLTARGA